MDQRAYSAGEVRVIFDAQINYDGYILDFWSEQLTNAYHKGYLEALQAAEKIIEKHTESLKQINNIQS